MVLRHQREVDRTNLLKHDVKLNWTFKKFKKKNGVLVGFESTDLKEMESCGGEAGMKWTLDSGWISTPHNRYLFCIEAG